MSNYVQAVIDELIKRLDDCPPELLDLYAQLVMTRGWETSLEDVHDAWSVWRNRTRPDHPSLVPFDQLTPEVQLLDSKYQAAIHEVAALTAVS